MNQRYFSTILVTGGCGFIGSNFIRSLFRRPDFDGNVINVDKLTYAGNPENLADVADEKGGNRYFFEAVDICDQTGMREIFQKYDIDSVVHFAAESHVDRSIYGPRDFVDTNVFGTFNLLECSRSALAGGRRMHFHHISTDEVYGSLGPTGRFVESTAYDPRSPYAATKAASDHLIRSYHHTYELPITISNCSNNYGPFQFPEKLIPLMILNIVEGKPLPVYGDGRQVRDWLFVDDHTAAIWAIMTRGRVGKSYNIGGDTERENIELVRSLCKKVANRIEMDPEQALRLIQFVPDRPGHDRRYAMDCTLAKTELQWSPHVDFDRGLDLTVDWYLANESWVKRIESGQYRDWISLNYGQR